MSTCSGMPADIDIVVIGAGVVGATVARDLVNRGMTVAVMDQAPGIGGGCSYANAAILAPSHVTPLATPALLREAPCQMFRRPPALRVKPDRQLVLWLGKLAVSSSRARLMQPRLTNLAERSMQLHCELARKNLSPTLLKTGAVDVYLRRPRQEPEGIRDLARLQEIEPTIARGVCGTHHTEEWTLESRSYVKAMLDDASNHGALVLFNTAVERLLIQSGRAVGVATGRGKTRAKHVVLATGLNTSNLAAQAGLNLALRGGRGYVVDLVAPSHDAPQVPVRIKEHRIVVTPLADRVRVCGSIEFGREDRPVEPRRGEALREIATRVLPTLRGQSVIDRWSGERPCTPDGLPIIGPSGVTENITIAAGHGMWGMILAPVTAELVAQSIIDGSLPGYDWLSPDRFMRTGASPRLGSVRKTV